MISDGEKQRVLQNLRDMVARNGDGAGVPAGRLLHLMGVDVGDDGCVTAAGVGWVADLMDMGTCSFDDCDMDEPFFYRTCTACGHYVDIRAVIDPLDDCYIRTRYCPNCGAKVVQWG